MYIENGYLVKDDNSELIVFLEIKTHPDAIGSNFYELKINKYRQYMGDNTSISFNIVTNPIEYMQKVGKDSPLSLNSLISYDELKKYYDYLIQAGIINETNNSNRQDLESRGTYSLKSSKYNTQDEYIYERKVK